MSQVRSMDEPMTPPHHTRSAEAVSTQQIVEIIQKHLRHVQLSPGVGVAKQGYAIGVIDDILAEISGIHPAPAGGNGVGRTDKQTDMLLSVKNPNLLPMDDIWNEIIAASKRIDALESHPALSVPEVKVPGHSVTEVDSINLQALHTTAIKCGMTNAYRGSLLQRIAKRMDDMHTEREPFSPQRTPAEVEGGESDMLTRSGLSWARRDNEILGITSDGQIGEQVVAGLMLAQASSVVGTHNRSIIKALSTSPRGKVPSLEQIERAICQSRTCEGVMCCQNPAQIGRTSCPVKAGGYADAAKAVLTLFTEGNARG